MNGYRVMLYLMCVAVLLGLSLLCAGVYLLLGLPWTLIATGVALLSVVALLSRGIRSVSEGEQP